MKSTILFHHLSSEVSIFVTYMLSLLVIFLPDHTYSAVELEANWEVNIICPKIYRLMSLKLCSLLGYRGSVWAVQRECTLCPSGWYLWGCMLNQWYSQVCHLPVWYTDLRTCWAYQETNTECRWFNKCTPQNICEEFRSDPSHKSEPQPSPACLSNALIPVDFTEDQQQIIKQSTELRFNIDNWVSFLISEVPASCEVCNCINWSTPILVRECSVVVDYQLFHGKGWL